jgi:glycosyltransferase involved in cell wall biosynthesis
MNSPKKKIIIVTEVFHPDESSTAQIMSNLAQTFSKHYDVHVICGPAPVIDFNYINNDELLGNCNKFKMTRIRVPLLNKNKIFQRFISGLIISVILCYHVFINASKGTIVFSVTNPYLLPIFLAFVKHIKKFQYFLLVHDIFPENAIAIGLLRKNSALSRLLGIMSNFAYRSVDCCITIGRDMSELILTKKNVPKNKIHIIENWPDKIAREFAERKTFKQQDVYGKEIVIGFAGNIGRAQGILDFASIVTQTNNKEICFKFAGNGAQKKELESQLKNYNNVIMSPGYSRSDQPKIMSSFDVGLIILGPGLYGLGVPSKTYNLLSFGKPILFIGPKDSEIYRMVEEENVGWAFDWDENEKIISFLNSIKVNDRLLLQEISNRSRLTSKKYSQEVAGKKFLSLIASFDTN